MNFKDNIIFFDIIFFAIQLIFLEFRKDQNYE